MPERRSQDLSVAELAADVQRLKTLVASYAHTQYVKSADTSLVDSPM